MKDRLVGAAAAVESVADTTADLVDAGLDTLRLGSHQLRNIRQPVELWAVELCPTHFDFSVDPVCRMRVSSQAAVARVHHAGREHWLCSLDCLRAFSSNPDHYLDSGDPPHP